MIFGSVCSGIESASIAWGPLEFKAAWFAETEPFPCSVLAHHWPEVPNVGDMCALPYLVSQGLVEAPDILVGGTPCQAFSVAGLRRGLGDERGQLTMKFVELANEIDNKRPGDECVVVWENVPGVLSSKDNAFGCFLAALAGEDEPLQSAGPRWSNAGCVFGPKRAIVWRTLDAQFFGVAQRRRRVFVVASARDGFNPSAVLFEREGVRRDTPPRREARQDVAWRRGLGFTPSSFGAYRQGIGTLRAADGGYPTVAQTIALRGREGGATAELGGDVAAALRASTGGGDKAHVMQDLVVRRLTPVECERLQGFPDGHTDVPHRGKPAADSPRYKAIGNSKAVPVIRFVGARIQQELNK